jgi:hypothetical protein
MAINVNTVYTTVLSILNKEQRGYLTPYEFNQLAAQVQLETFENFFEDYNQYIRMPKTDVEFASRMDHIHEEFQVFEKNDTASAVTGNVYTQPTDLHRFGSAFYETGINDPEIQIVSKREYHQQKLSTLTQPTTNFPIAIYQEDKLTVYPATTTPVVGDIGFNYIRKPVDPRWGYSVGSLGQFVYDSTVYGANLLNTGTSTLTSSITTNQTDFVNGTYTGTVGVTAGYSTSGTGTGLIVSISVVGNTVTSVDVTTAGTGYAAGDTVTVTGSGGVLGGGTGNLVITLAASDFNSGNTYGSTNFEISDSQQTDVILKILQYAGVIIRDPSIIQAAQQELMQDQANEKR